MLVSKQYIKNALPPVLERSISRPLGWYKYSRIKLRLLTSRLNHRQKFKDSRNLKLHIGCGKNILRGFVNIDYASESLSVLRWDCANQKFPFADGSCDYIFAEHFFEHLSVPSEANFFLNECRRCLSEEGVLRLVVPDAGLYLNCYQQQGWDNLVDIRPLRKLGEVYEDLMLGSVYKTKMEMINSVFRQYGEHKFAYDEETLTIYLKNAQFSKVVRMSFGDSLFRESPPDLDSRRKESLYIEAMK